MDDLEKEELEALRKLERWARVGGLPKNILEELDAIQARKALPCTCRRFKCRGCSEVHIDSDPLCPRHP